MGAEANQLLISLGSAPAASAAGPLAQAGALVAAGGYASPGVLGDELSEEELRVIFRERRENIERKFANAEAKTPESFMRPVPFQITSSAGQKLLTKSGAATRHEEDGGGGSTRPTSAAAFMTSVEEDSGNGGRPRRLLVSAEGKD